MAKIVILGGLGDLGSIRTSSNISDSVSSPQGGKSNIESADKTVLTDIRGLSDIERKRTGEPFNKIDFAIPNKKSTVSFSKDSVSAPYYSLWNNFNFTADPHYNFFVEDEETNDTMTVGDRKLSDIPRYIRLSWDHVPTTTRVVKRLEIQPATKRTRSTSLRVRSITQNSARGLSFKRDDKLDFSTAINSLSNGFLSPGIIRAIVELPLDKAGFKMLNRTPKIDEHRFLTSESTEGLSIHDIQSNVNIRTNGILGAEKIDSDIVSKETKIVKKDLFSKQFSISKNNKKSLMNIHDVSSNSATISLNVTTSSKSLVASFDSLKDDDLDKLMNELIKKQDELETSESDFTEVNFVDPAIVGLVKKEKVDLISRPEHAENMASIAQFLPNLKMVSELNREIKRKKIMPSFPSTQDEEGTEYIGYVIEKYAQGDDGVFTLIDEIEIQNVDKTSYIDTSVKYGTIYRYRIRTILSWVRKGSSTELKYTSTKSLASYKKSFFGAEWSRKWKYATVVDVIEPNPPDEFRVMPQSDKNRVIISWKVPDDSQRDIHYFNLYRKLQDENGNDITDWEFMSTQFGPSNSLVIDNEVDYFQNNGLVYVYAALTATRHGEFSKLSCQIGVRLNEQYKFSGEYPVSNVSAQGVSLISVGAFATSPIRRLPEDIIAKNSVMLTSRDGAHEIPFLDSSYCIRIESLDTGERKDIMIDISHDNGISPQIIEKSSVSYVSSDKMIENEDLIRNLFDGPITSIERGSPSENNSDRGTKK